MLKNIRSRWFVALFALFAMVAGILPASAQVNGTNAVLAMESTVSYASTTAWSLAIGILLGLVAISVFMKIGRKGGVRS